ncbi:RxLR effector candidate protein [Phytophthora cinnamomi]|uniref:RxLR effector candidate protein n=1 Tax=Phytophthora cinnamomi TaxID=4785 RepID=UPI0035595488|nr:RxLR effector candidate protein [Phytophthora cinnamomi]
MGSARRLLLGAAVALIMAAETRAGMTLPSLTLSPDADSLIITRGESTNTGTGTSRDALIGSAPSPYTKKTEAPVTEAPATWAPATTAPATMAPSSSYAYSTSNSGEQDTIDTPSSATATVSPSKKATQTETQTQTEASKSTATVDQLNDKNGGFTSGNNSSGNSLGAAVPAVLGALACVGAIVMAVTYKKKSNNTSDEDATRPNSDCEYTGDIDFTPENRTLTSVPENSPTAATSKAPVLASQSGDFTVGAASVDFGSSASSIRSTSPFASSRCDVRVSSPLHNFYSSSEANMEFQDPSVRHEGGSHVVLTFDENTDRVQL